MAIIEQLKRLGKDTISYGFSSALQKLITIFLFPIYARLLSPADFGIQDVIQTSVYIATLFLVLGLDSSVMMYYYEANDKDKKNIVSTYLWFEILVSFPITLLLILGAGPICEFILNNKDLAVYFQLGVAAIPFSLAVGSMLSTLRLTFQTKKFVLMTTVGVLFQISFAILFVIVFGWGIKGVMISVLISFVLQALLGVFLTRHYYNIHISRSWLIKLLRVGIPVIPAALSFWIMSYANRFFLVEYSTLEDIGLLSIVNRVSSILLLFLTAFSSAWGPYAFSLASKPEEARQAYGKILTYFTLFSLTVALGISLFARELILVLATSVYEKGSSLVMAFCLSSVIWSAMYIVGMGTGIAKKNYHYTISVILGASINTLFNYFLIPQYGIAGAVYSTLLGNLASIVYIYFAGQHYFKVAYEAYNLIVIIMSALAVTLLGIFLDSRFETWSVLLTLYKGLSFLLFLGMLITFKVITKEIVQKFLLILKGKFNRQKINID